MRLLFSDAGMARLADAAQPGLLCAFDFDGTLSPIVAAPDKARLPGEVHERLLELSQFAPLAIITGRSLHDIRHRLGFSPDFLVGNHGIEGVPGWDIHVARLEAMCREWLAQLSEAIQELDPGISLEDKRYSLSVHFRHARDPERTGERLGALLEKLAPHPRIVAGKYVFNLVAPDARHKGDALEQLMKASEARCAVYIGDDVTDEDVFRLPRERLLSIRVEHRPDSAAEFYLSRIQDVLPVLKELVQRLRDSGAHNWLRSASGH